MNGTRQHSRKPSSPILLTHYVISQFTISSHFRDSMKLDQKGREWWERVARAILARRSEGKGQDQQGCAQQHTRHETKPMRQHSRKTSSPALLTHGVISHFTISSHFRDNTKLDQKGREWWGRVARASLAGRSGGKGHPTRQHSRKTSSPALLTHGVISKFTISSHFRDSTKLDQTGSEWCVSIETAVGEVRESGQMSRDAHSSTHDTKPTPPASTPVSPARLHCLPMASSPNSPFISSHFRDSTKLDQKGREWWGGLREPALLGELRVSMGARKTVTNESTGRGARAMAANDVSSPKVLQY